MTPPLDDDDLMRRVRAAAPPALPDPVRLDALAQRIAASAAPALATRARRGDGVVAIASRWSRVAIPLAMAAGVGALMVLTQAGSGVAGRAAGSAVAATATDTVTTRLVASLTIGEGPDGGAALAAASGLALEATR